MAGKRKLQGERLDGCVCRGVDGMSEQFSGVVTVVDGEGREVFRFDAQFAVLDIGGLQNEGDLRLRGDDGGLLIWLCSSCSEQRN